MRLLLVLVLAANTFLMYSCQSNDIDRDLYSSQLYPDHPNYKLTAEQTGYIESSKIDGYTEFGIRLRLTSKFDTLPPFIYMTCSWGSENGVVSDRNYLLGLHGCDANFRTFNHLDSDEVLFLETVIGRKGSFVDFKYDEIRVGFGIVDTLRISIDQYWRFEEHCDSYEWEQKYKYLARYPEHIVWSNPIKLQKMNVPINHGGNVRKIEVDSMLD